MRSALNIFDFNNTIAQGGALVTQIWRRPQALRTVVRLMLNSGHPMYIFWKSDHACLYNDAYRQSIGPERHPASLGRPAREVWDEIWPVINSLTSLDWGKRGHKARVLTMAGRHGIRQLRHL